MKNLKPEAMRWDFPEANRQGYCRIFFFQSSLERGNGIGDKTRSCRQLYILCPAGQRQTKMGSGVGPSTAVLTTLGPPMRKKSTGASSCSGGTPNQIRSISCTLDKNHYHMNMRSRHKMRLQKS